MSSRDFVQNKKKKERVFIIGALGDDKPSLHDYVLGLHTIWLPFDNFGIMGACTGPLLAVDRQLFV